MSNDPIMRRSDLLRKIAGIAGIVSDAGSRNVRPSRLDETRPTGAASPASKDAFMNQLVDRRSLVSATAMGAAVGLPAIAMATPAAAQVASAGYVSPVLIALIAEAKAAEDEMNASSDATDEVLARELGRTVTREDRRRFNVACRRDRRARLRMCAFHCTTLHEFAAKAQALTPACGYVEMQPEEQGALLASMRLPAQRKPV